MNGNILNNWATGKLIKNDIIFDSPDGIKKAFQDGFFFIEKPHSLSLEAGDIFASEFYHSKMHKPNDEYRGFKTWTSEKLGKRQGYFIRSNDQVEQFFLEKAHWENVYPPQLIVQANQMQQFGIQIVNTIFSYLNIPSELWDKASGYSLSGKGSYHLTFNHYRPTIKARGLNTHKDSGWVTVLRSFEPGLEVLINQEWLPVIPKQNHFIVNFGCAMEILTKHAEYPVSAVVHRVSEQNENRIKDRFSYALFVDSSLNKQVSDGLYRYSRQQGLQLETDFEEFLNHIDHSTYEKGSSEFN
ncbi:MULTISPECIES: 2OG-Fe(II) oxygenase family protein [Providencia]|uniref:2OG-Fe(II) oxygenase family protein n=2 Tax=Morganellaceae TaxID=1903414 RepID=UPI0008399A86|nr:MULTISPECIES: 2OG-Fe(II) oxygenase family protein [Providencia]MBP6122792.1 isopenicillin N synthase family oxygenase [Providencia sp.]NIH23900.1 isopenicillin N synthase family oxygenase [Providencia heimbachae]